MGVNAKGKLTTWWSNVLQGKTPRGMGWKRWLRLVGVMLGLLGLYGICQVFYLRVDLTADKRHTLTQLTRNTLRKMEGRLYIKVFLGGDLPLDFQRLRLGVDELLEEYQVASRYKVRVMYEDPHDEEQHGAARQEYHRQLMEWGVQPVSVRERLPNGTLTERLVFPAASVSYQGKTLYSTIYRDDGTQSVPTNINTALEGLEYQLTGLIRRLVTPSRARVGFLQGHGELTPLRMAHWLDGLAQSYRVEPIDTLPYVGCIDSLTMLVIANPEAPFTEREKLVLDQYIMRGGSLLLMVSPTHGAIDSLELMGRTLLYGQDLNLGDMLFGWGVRLSPVAVQDEQCAVIPINTALAGQPTRFTPFPWVYYPLLQPADNDVISRNLNRVYSRFPGVVEVLGGGHHAQGDASPVRVRELLYTSTHARLVPTPRLVDLAEVERNPESLRLRGGPYPVVVALEGTFRSGFRNRPVERLAGERISFLAEGQQEARIVVASYGGLAENGVSFRGGEPHPLPLGFDRFTQQTFGNKEFLDNVAHYLCGHEELLELRGRELTLRLIDMGRVYTHRVLWSLVAVGGSLLLLGMLGGGVALWRRWHVRSSKLSKL